MERRSKEVSLCQKHIPAQTSLIARYSNKHNLKCEAFYGILSWNVCMHCYWMPEKSFVLFLQQFPHTNWIFCVLFISLESLIYLKETMLKHTNQLKLNQTLRMNMEQCSSTWCVMYVYNNYMLLVQRCYEKSIGTLVNENWQRRTHTTHNAKTTLI